MITRLQCFSIIEVSGKPGAVHWLLHQLIFFPYVRRVDREIPYEVGSALDVEVLARQFTNADKNERLSLWQTLSLSLERKY